MIKTYCDCCEELINDSNIINGNHERLTGQIVKSNRVALKVEVITAEGSTWNSGDFCKYCVIDAINEADDRPSAGE